ncbi:unnamed protein product [Brassica oleracea var. botrytis]
MLVKCLLQRLVQRLVRLRRWESPKKGLHLMNFKSQLQVRQSVGTNLGMMCFVSCVCLDESLYVGTCVFVSSVLGSLLMYGFCLIESVNGAKAGQNDPQEPSSLKDLSLVIANEPEGKPTEQSGEPSVLVLDKGVPTDSDLQKGETRRQRTKDAAMVHVRGKSDRARKLAASQQSPFKGNNTAKVIIPNKRVGQGYDHFAPFDKKMSKVFTDWVKLDTYFKTPMDKKPRRFPSRFYHTLRTPIEWLNDGVSLLLCLLSSGKSSLEDITEDLLDDLIWSHKYPEFKSDEGDINCLGRRLPCGAWNYHAGIVPTFCQSMKVWGLDVDDIYAPVNFRNEHWIAMWILIPKKHIVVWDNIISHIRAAELDVVMEPFVTMVPYLLVECAGSDEDRVQHTLEPYTYERVIVGVPQC